MRACVGVYMRKRSTAGMSNNIDPGVLDDDTDSIRYVQVYIEFRRIGEIDTMNEKYHADFSIESKWIERQELVGDEYDPRRDWNPKLFIENLLSDPKEIINYKYIKQNDGNHVVVEKRFVRGQFWERLELKNFPFDVQELSITLSSRLSKNEVKLVADQQRKSMVTSAATRTFQDQQKW